MRRSVPYARDFYHRKVTSVDKELPALNHVSEDPTPGPEGSLTLFESKWPKERIDIPRGLGEKTSTPTERMEDLKEALFPAQSVPKQAAPGTGQIVVSEKQWDEVQQRWELRLRNQREVIDNLDAARIQERDQRAALLEKLATVREDLSALVRAETDVRHRTNYGVLRDTIADLIKVYR